MFESLLLYFQLSFLITQLRKHKTAQIPRPPEPACEIWMSPRLLALTWSSPWPLQELGSKPANGRFSLPLSVILLYQQFFFKKKLHGNKNENERILEVLKIYMFKGPKTTNQPARSRKHLKGEETCEGKMLKQEWRATRGEGREGRKAGGEKQQLARMKLWPREGIKSSWTDSGLGEEVHECPQEGGKPAGKSGSRGRGGGPQGHTPPCAIQD